ncbi:glycosyltransferase [Flavobacterium aquidurense]|uniref:glycosyltransferase n=1 Tax=Flavobacterium aquidurense TaxID=362413 RepID=UPI0028585219|nr:glycosyltransferase [Flavobacterium aquidurense]MDR7372331.1 glycosyltransferase involved in cell wall biosynthesis [Flavobacterium aquidurense]
MKVLLVNTYDRGGAANACKRLHLGFLLKGINSNVLLRFKQNNWPESKCFRQPQKKNTFHDKVLNKAKRILKELKLYSDIDVSKRMHQDFLSQRNRNLEMFSFPNSDLDITQSELYKEADIINLHWVANFLDYKTFFEINKKPVVWTLHDMNPFTGGEHYLEEFLGIDKDGYPIKRKLSPEEIQISNENLTLKKEVLDKFSNLTVVTPSEWLAKKARESQVFKNAKIHCIPYGLDASIYTPRDKKYSRELLSIPEGKQVILFVADSISNNRKGFIFLKRAFEQLSDSNLVLCAIGDKNSDLELIENVLELGSIYDERLMSIAYSAADVFVIPSLMDNLPNTVLESLLCGTPVIGFPVGGIVDMIQDGVNGFLTDEISVNSLMITLQKFLKNPSCFDRVSIREDAIKKYDQSVQSQKYIDLFSSIQKSTEGKKS